MPNSPRPTQGQVPTWSLIVKERHRTYCFKFHKLPRDHLLAVQGETPQGARGHSGTRPPSTSIFTPHTLRAGERDTQAVTSRPDKGSLLGKENATIHGMEQDCGLPPIHPSTFARYPHSLRTWPHHHRGLRTHIPRHRPTHNWATDTALQQRSGAARSPLLGHRGAHPKATDHQGCRGARRWAGVLLRGDGQRVLQPAPPTLEPGDHPSATGVFIGSPPHPPPPGGKVSSPSPERVLPRSDPRDQRA